MLNRENWEQIRRGAEASIWKMSLFGMNCVAKVAEPKTWRVKQLDEKLRSERIQNEARTNLRCMRLGIPVAPIVYIDKESTTYVMQELTGPTLKHAILDCKPDGEPQIIEILKEMGRIIAKMHNFGVIHSDLTTSNFMLHNGQLRIIDFGLAFASDMDEDKAVDLYVMERAFNSSHPNKQHLIDIIIQTYFENSIKAEQVQRRLKKVRSRGRKRTMVG